VSGPPRAIVEHAIRLDMLCCLREHGPMTVPGLAIQLRRVPIAVAVLMEPLVTHKVVTDTGDRIGEEPLYEFRLDDQPAWLREAVEAHCGGH
jgi:hypothetical protein